MPRRVPEAAIDKPGMPDGVVTTKGLARSLRTRRSMTHTERILPRALNFALGFGAVLVAVDMALTGRCLGHANSDQRHEAGSRYNKTEDHAEETTLSSS